MSAATRLQLRVAARTRQAQDVCSFELVAADGAPLPPFAPGAHLELDIAPGLRRCYSLCNDPAERHRYEIAVLRAAPSRGGSAAVHAQWQVGDRVLARGPRNLFALAPEARHSLLLAAGIGITPLLAMAEHLAGRGAPLRLHYCARTPQQAAFHDRILASRFAAQTTLHFSQGPAPRRFDLARALAAPAPGTHVYVCGPEGFMRAALATARTLGWPEAQLHAEAFGAASASAQPDPDADTAFALRLARSGRQIHVAHDRTAAQALLEAGVDLPTACEQGVCGTCLTRVLEGVPAHRDQYLSADEQAAGDQFLPCCSRARTPLLVLDL